jgi:hypothetical protein
MPGADAAFLRAVADEPENDTYFAWRILTTLAQGDELRTKAKLAALLKRNPRGISSPNIALQFERVQGQLRQRLHELETETLQTLGTVTD